ncbi:50S ribosomal protein L31, chloroplastic [Dioscorea cayenensis subsp. rotundata]|uniref:50S ribosomal protein L31 n=1 Tax=Dioscorea cayennensis subsp. rotundata TaxID=55577 RepID=A0AB40B6D8_DIOCR|nr:50S ribosomal protein L31, chloroplastic [Dioscorea cayenensis subsp. rotundata]
MALTLTTPFLPSLKASPKSHRMEVKPKSVMVECRKKGGIHPEFHEDAKVYCNGELVMTTGGTQKEYTVDVWSGNHPFYLGNRSALLIDADQVEKFRKKYGDMSPDLLKIPVLKHGEIVLPTKKKAAPGKGKGKK